MAEMFAGNRFVDEIENHLHRDGGFETPLTQRVSVCILALTQEGDLWAIREDESGVWAYTVWWDNENKCIINALEDGCVTIRLLDPNRPGHKTWSEFFTRYNTMRSKHRIVNFVVVR